MNRQSVLEEVRTFARLVKEVNEQLASGSSVVLLSAMWASRDLIYDIAHLFESNSWTVSLTDFARQDNIFVCSLFFESRITTACACA